MSRRIYLLYGLTLLLALLSCKESAFVEESIVDGLDKKILYKSFTLPVSTVLYPDSVVTQNDNMLLVGRYNSSIFGDTQSSAITTFRPTSISDIKQIPEEVSSYDSVVFSLQISYIYGKKESNFGLSIHPLKERLRRMLYVAETEVEYEEEKALQGSTIYNIANTDSLRMHATQSWSESVFEKLKGEDRNDILFNYPGFILISHTENETLLGLSPRESNITIYYKDPSKDTTMTISFLLDGVRYNQFSVDRRQSLLNIERGKHTKLSQYAYAQSATGVFSVIDLSAVANLYKEVKGFDIHIAKLSIGPLLDRSTSDISYPTTNHLRLLLPYEDPKDIRNNNKELRNRVLINEDSQIGGSNFFSKVSEENPTFEGNIAIGLQQDISLKEHIYWLLSSSDPNGLESIVLPSNSVRLHLYYSLRK